MNTDFGWPVGGLFLLPLMVISLLAFGVFILVGGMFIKLARNRNRIFGDRRFTPGMTLTSPDNTTQPPIIDDSLTNPANPLYHVHHPPSHAATDFPSSPGMDFSSSQPSSASMDFSSPSPSFDSGSSSSSMDSGSASGGCSNP